MTEEVMKVIACRMQQVLNLGVQAERVAKIPKKLLPAKVVV
jgi:hypothetical protein